MSRTRTNKLMSTKNQVALATREAKVNGSNFKDRRENSSSQYGHYFKEKASRSTCKDSTSGRVFSKSSWKNSTVEGHNNSVSAYRVKHFPAKKEG